MKIRILPLFAIAMIAASSLFSSCLKSDHEELDLPSASSISSFSLGTLYQTIYKGSSEGKDTIDTINYAKHPFVIDQINRKIYNPDSLPKGVDISRALVKMSGDGSIFYVNKEGRDSIWSPADSLDLTEGLTLKVLTYSPVYKDFRYGKPYNLTVNVHKYNPDSLVWSHSENIGFKTDLSEQKAVYSNNHIYVFGKDNDNNVKVYKIKVNKGKLTDNWTEESNLSNNNINIYSALAYNNNIYYVNQYGALFSINGVVSSKAGLKNLISVSNGYILAYKDDNSIIAIDKDGYKKSDDGKLEEGNDFSGRIFATSYPTEHNNNLWRTTVMSNSKEANDTTANIFSHISNENIWIKNTPNPPAICPDFENISMIKYDGKLYAFGGESNKGNTKIKAFENFYYSNNHGYDWRIEPNKYMKFETEKLTELYSNKAYSCVVETDSEGKESFIWFVWHDGKISRAHLNKFAPKN